MTQTDNRFIRILIALFVALMLSACQSTTLYPAFAAPSNAMVIQAKFKHFALSQPGTSQRLHVYIEGDGLPFENRLLISRDPTPTNPMMLALMKLDDHSSLYLGRPCYFTRSLPAMTDEQCGPKLWTNARYSKDVVNSMVEALRQQPQARTARGITLIGHSGGGTLAMLMASRMGEVDQVVTLAGNLDISAWAGFHHYTSLKDSLNPADLPGHVFPRKQLHFVGDKDNNIPPKLSQHLVQRMGLELQIIKGADHNCCWYEQWPLLLRQINQQMSR